MSPSQSTTSINAIKNSQITKVLLLIQRIIAMIKSGALTPEKLKTMVGELMGIISALNLQGCSAIKCMIDQLVQVAKDYGYGDITDILNGNSASLNAIQANQQLTGLIVQDNVQTENQFLNTDIVTISAIQPTPTAPSITPTTNHIIDPPNTPTIDQLTDPKPIPPPSHCIPLIDVWDLMKKTTSTLSGNTVSLEV